VLYSGYSGGADKAGEIWLATDQNSIVLDPDDTGGSDIQLGVDGDGDMTQVYGTLNVDGNNGNAAYSHITIRNNDEGATGETSQTIDNIFEFKATIDDGSNYTNQEAGKLSWYKISDYFHASDETDQDAGAKLYTVTNGSFVENSTWSDDDLTVVGDIQGAVITDGAFSTTSGAVTGVTTLSMNNQLTSTLADGTKPFVITSTTMCDNLNADLLDGEEASAFQDVDATLTALAGLTIGANELIYGTGADAFSMLGVNATATNKFLRQVSSGAPSWEALEAGDIPDISGTYQPLHASLTSISGLTEADVSIIETTADNTYNVVTSGGNNYILGSSSDNSTLEFKSPTGSGSPVLATSPTLVTPALGAATATSLVATGVISGETSVKMDVIASVTLTADSCRNHARFNNDADVIDYTLPAAEAGLVIMFYDIGGGVITVDPYDGTDTIYLNGTSVGAGDAIDSPGNAGNFIVLMAVDDTRWVTLGRSGVWVDGGAD